VKMFSFSSIIRQSILFFVVYLLLRRSALSILGSFALFSSKPTSPDGRSRGAILVVLGYFPSALSRVLVDLSPELDRGKQLFIDSSRPYAHNVLDSTFSGPSMSCLRLSHFHPPFFSPEFAAIGYYQELSPFSALIRVGNRFLCVRGGKL